jgi:hypothetical protein
MYKRLCSNDSRTKSKSRTGLAVGSHSTGICVVCTTQSNDMMLCLHLEAPLAQWLTPPNQNNFIVLLLLTLQLSKCLANNDTQPLLISASPRLSRDTPLDYHRTHGTVKRVFARHPRSQCSCLNRLRLWGSGRFLMLKRVTCGVRHSHMKTGSEGTSRIERRLTPSRASTSLSKRQR